MIKYKYNIGILLILFLMSSCGDFLDVNTDPTRVDESTVTMKILLPTVIDNTAYGQYSTALNASQVTHQLDNIIGYYGDFSMSGAWSTVYLRALENAATIIRKADEESSPHYAGVAKVLQAVNLGLLTDCWENVPYSEALQGATISTPMYDTQEEIYTNILTLLDDAVLDLSQEESFTSPSSDDLVYGGDLDKWIKVAHSLKARYMLHLSGKSDNTDAILAELAHGMTSNDDDFQLVYDGLITNPFYANIAKKITESIFTYNFSEYFIDGLNGDFANVPDPRLPVIAELNEAGTDYLGLLSYGDDFHDANLQPTGNTFYFGATAPLLMMTYSESKFIEAEMLMKKGADATSAYQEGISSHMSKLGISGTDYMASPTVSTVNMNNIMRQKYIALMLNTEVWNDMRRHDFNTDIYTGFEEPNIEERSVPAQRALYPDSEKSRNASNFEANTKGFTTKMWKDL